MCIIVQFKYMIFHIFTGIENYSVEDFVVFSVLNNKSRAFTWNIQNLHLQHSGKYCQAMNGLKILAKKKKKKTSKKWFCLEFKMF